MKAILALIVSVLLMISVANAKPIVIGVATDTEILDGFATIRGLKMAVEEINSAGGSTLKGKSVLSKLKSWIHATVSPAFP